jgi:ABC-type lipoprotein release transport system permease subunit
VPIRILTEGLAAASVFPVDRPDGRWSALPETLGYLLILMALVFVIGVECGATVFPALRVRESQAKDEG